MSIFRPPLRPPGAVEENLFSHLCIRCGKCIAACPYHTIRLTGGFSKNRLLPHIIPREHPCHLCMRCTPVCPSGALDPSLSDLAHARIGKAHMLKHKCHNFIEGDIMCTTCFDRCPLKRRSIILGHGGIIPVITEACVGCGVCECTCPQNAIIVLPENYPAPEGAIPHAKAGTWS